MSEISLSKAVRSNLLSLQGTAELMSKTQDRLASGNKVNSALDNPSNWFTAQGLNNRASDLGALLDSMANGVQTLEAADNGLTAMTKTLESMQSTLRQARQDKSFQTSSFELTKVNANDPTLGKLSFSGGAVTNTVNVDLIKTGSGATSATAATYAAPTAAAPASYTSTNVTLVAADADDARTFTINFGGKTAVINLASDAARDDLTKLTAAINAQILDSDLSGQVSVTNNAGKLAITAANNVDGAITVTGTNAVATFGDPADATIANRPASVTGSNGTHDFIINGKTISLTAVTGADVATSVASINTQLGDNRKFEAFASGSKIGIRAIADDAGSLSIGGADAAMFTAPANSTTLKFARSTDELVTAINADAGLKGNVRASNDNGKLRIENLSTSVLDVQGLTDGKITGGVAAAEITGNSVRTGLASQFNELRDQLDKLADDASFNGINLLRGDKLTITFNETGTSSIDIQTKDGKTVNASNLGVPTSMDPEDLDSDVSIDALLAEMKTALDQVRSQASSFGSNLSIVENRQKFTKSMIDTLQTGAGNLTLADMNEEAANLLALQTRQQLSQNSLSLASQADQSVLQLLR